jgi:ABC-type multidrug transport system ATPase subunit
MQFSNQIKGNRLSKLKVAIEARELGKDFGTTQAVKSVSFTVNEGEVFGFFGPNGAGKTTTIRLLCGLTKPTRGDARVCGHSIRVDPTGVRRHLTMMLEESAFYEKMKVTAYLKFFAAMSGQTSKFQHEKIQGVVNVCELSESLNKRIAVLSHGQRQKVSLARAFLSDVPIMFLDEPFQGIDIVHRRMLRDYLREYVKKGNTVFFTSHNLIEAEQIVDRFAFIDRGAILKVGTARELRDQYLAPTYSIRVSDPVEARQVLSDGIPVNECTLKGEEVIVILKNKEDALKISSLLSAAGVAILEMRMVGTMEEVFLKMRQNTETD